MEPVALPPRVPKMRALALATAAIWTLAVPALLVWHARADHATYVEPTSLVSARARLHGELRSDMLGCGALWVLGLAAIVSVAAAAERRHTQRRSVEEELRASQARLASVFRAAPVGIGVVSNRVLVQVNDRACEIAGRDRATLIGQSARVLYPDDREFEWVGTEKYRQIAEHGTGTVETRWLRGDGRVIDVLLSSTPLNPANLEAGVTFTVLDISERKRAERERAELAEQLFQAQKMQAIGQLAGGVAHDFNNQLAAIQGYASILREVVGSHAAAADPLDQIDAAVRRSANLTSRLLAFARKGKYLTVPVDLHQQVEEVCAILGRSIDKRIRIEKALEAQPSTTAGDPTQIENALLNLAVNARDAMPDGGTIRFASRIVDVAAASVEQRGLELAPGRFVALSVSDTGCGMEQATRERLFEPFFTTKEPGKGTGLGLASVFGTLKSHRGAVRVTSEPGRGSTFETFWPLAEQRAEPALDGKPALANAAPAALDGARSLSASGVPAEDATAPSGTLAVPADTAAAQVATPPIGAAPPATADTRSAGLSVLVVDDEDGVRKALAGMIERLGCRVRQCRDGVEAVEEYTRACREIDLVVLDLTMPRMNGLDAFAELRRVNPEVRVLLSSGYGLEGEPQRLFDQGLAGYLQKPYTMATVSEALAGIRPRTST